MDDVAASSTIQCEPSQVVFADGFSDINKYHPPLTHYNCTDATPRTIRTFPTAPHQHDSPESPQRSHLSFHSSSVIPPTTMPIVISYPALRCVIEFLDAAKRQYVTARCPSLRLVNQTIPLHVENLNIGELYLEIIGKSQFSAQFFTNQQVSFWDKNHVRRRTARFNMEQKEAIKKFYDYWLGSRSDIYVNHVSFGGSSMTMGNLPVNFSLTVNKFLASHGNFESFLPAINPASYALDSVEISTTGVLSLNHPVLHTAQNLTIITNQDTNHEHLLINKIRNKNVFIGYEFIILADLLEIIEDWMFFKREIGTTFTFFEDFRNDVSATLNQVYEELHDCRKEWKEENNQEHMIREYRHFFIEIDDASKILVYGERTREGTGSRVVFKVVAMTDAVEDVDMEADYMEVDYMEE
ncbi:hypothetical protein GCK72_008013 [Caenorhabditis remanei]|uniref:Uncharacterized protein n=1 Tax=Caenorhabditis remanei TaxID=31234 RepID=A0A6A5HQH0_CAERE|nr:hypothetical protein GCK72_008013 [Caenorhabditis remanei]KAF1768052.1 hypothetical protein GCK72_008013 [Caenorhabditis remanei]